MKHLNSRGIAVAIVIVMVLGSMMFLFGSEEASAQERDNEIKITWGGGRQWYPAVFGNRITWKDGPGQIFVYDAKTKDIRKESYGFSASRSDIYGDYVIYEDDRLEYQNWDIYVLDTVTGIETHMHDGSRQQYGPRIWGDSIVWYEKEDDYWRIAWGRVGFDSYSYINWGNINQSHPDVCGRSVVYEDDSNGNLEIYYWDYSEREEVRLTNNKFDQRFPRISGEKVVWTDYRNEHSDIYMYDLMTEEETRITYDTADQKYPVIHDDIIVWQDYRNGNWDIYMMDLNDRTPIQVTTNIYNQSFPDVHGDIIVWEDHRPEVAEYSDKYNIFMTFIDQDDDGIFDWNDPYPTIPHFPLESLEYKMDSLMVQLQLTELNLTTRVQTLRMELATGFIDFTNEMIDEVGDGVAEILADLETHDNTLWGTNNTMRMEFAALKAELASMKENITMGEEEELDIINSYLETLEELIVQVRTSIEIAISELALELEEEMGATSANMSTKLEEIQTSLEELQTLDDIVADLETMSKEVEKVESNTKDEGFGLFEIMVIVLLIFIMFLVFISMFTRRKPQNSESYEW